MAIRSPLIVALYVTFALAAAPVAQADELSAPDAYALASAGEVTLIDVRSPSEWRQTGLPAHGKAVTIHDPEGLPAFVRKIVALLGNNPAQPVALICASGVRSAYAEKLLEQAGFTAVYNVTEGMLGGRAGPGWLKHALPTASAQ